MKKQDTVIIGSMSAFTMPGLLVGTNGCDSPNAQAHPKAARRVSVVMLALLGLGGVSCSTGTTDEQSGTNTEDQLQVAKSEMTSACACQNPSNGFWATFQVGRQTFNQQLTRPSAIADAIAAWQGKSTKHIPVGKLECSCVGWNCQWSNWHMIPSTVELADNAIEICDGMPSDVQRNCPNFGGGSYCPWMAKLTNLRDCRSNSSCPVVPQK